MRRFFHRLADFYATASAATLGAIGIGLIGLVGAAQSVAPTGAPLAVKALAPVQRWEPFGWNAHQPSIPAWQHDSMTQLSRKVTTEPSPPMLGVPFALTISLAPPDPQTVLDPGWFAGLYQVQLELPGASQLLPKGPMPLPDTLAPTWDVTVENLPNGLMTGYVHLRQLGPVKSARLGVGDPRITFAIVAEPDTRGLFTRYRDDILYWVSVVGGLCSIAAFFGAILKWMRRRWRPDGRAAP
ncbi:hypothetical protein KDD17_07855 [Sulfitobacter albidus]|uniref:Uncharacterized protein n=1 Tax=Sulfitobacter albidus TaxID=2829501 RepID=A0A975PNG8_9RHOB|nr:hypothetical protein [Sulfitobacter albidus]QUJ77837.1 hypothetical protein KDD17_07855 [Sulfitobacter albidus]